MKKVRKGKKKLILIIAVIVAIIAIVLIGVFIKKKISKPDDTVTEQQVIGLPDTTYNGMEVKNIQMVYLQSNNQTLVEMSIYNTSNEKVEDESFNAILIGPNENVLGQMLTYIQEVDVGDQCNVSVVLSGDLTATQQIKLEKK